MNRTALVIFALGVAAAFGCGGRETGTGSAPTCSDRGVVYANATVWICSDGCNTCACSSGKIVSTLLACVANVPEGGDAELESSVEPDASGEASSGADLDGNAETGSSTEADSGDATSSASGDGAADANVCGPPPPGCARAFAASPCQAGFICDPTHGCAPTSCGCDPERGWFCTGDCGGGVCVPAPEAGGPGAACPSAEPAAGGPCEGPIACPYMGPCGTVVWTCGASKSYWVASVRVSCSGKCPATEPKQGDPCLAGGKCSYTSACGSQDTVYCDGNGTVSRVDQGACPQCPAQEPTPMAPCAGSLSCPYTNQCGGTDMVGCSASAWTVLRGDCEK